MVSIAGQIGSDMQTNKLLPRGFEARDDGTGELTRVPTIDLPVDELQAAIAAIRGLIEADQFPLSPRLDPLRAALGKLKAPEPIPNASRRRDVPRTPRRAKAASGRGANARPPAAAIAVTA